MHTLVEKVSEKALVTKELTTRTARTMDVKT